MDNGPHGRGFDPKARLVSLAVDDRRRGFLCDGGHGCLYKPVAEATFAVQGLRERFQVFYCLRHAEAFAHRHGLEVIL